MLCGFELKARCDVVEIIAVEAAPTRTFALDDDTGSSGADTPDPAVVARMADAQAVAVALVKPALHAALTGHPAHLDVTREMLFEPAFERLSPEHVLFELPAALVADDEVIARLVVLHGRRFRFVLDEVVAPDDHFARLLPYAAIVKIDIARIAPALLPKLASVLKSAGKILIALGVDSQTQFEEMLKLGFDRFQGYFFARAQNSSTRRVSAPRHALLNLLQLLAGDPTVAQLENELKLNPVLVMHLMRLANSGGMGLGRKVSTLRDAINATGTDRIARWTQLLLYADGRKVALEDDPLLQLAATRARFMELAIERLPQAGRDEADAAFLTGVFSFVDAVFGGSLESTLNVLTLSKPIQAAILHREGRLGRLLAAIDAIERGAWDEIDGICAELAPLTTGDVAELALGAAAWAGVAEQGAEAAGLERIED
ncbi:EAL domain-containing protein [Paraburkholderia sp.]|uniref:EAL and HDOD domain-containing protein n=1 Tax=Paraburkholderia sp. TaxID=1926495 RepID=UPI00238F654C|nr:EAL domain-containing protein [Paraburkholderia sp.]MDE1184578.1 EAL domain-containing protein [Paraburkholderia sp.]